MQQQRTFKRPSRRRRERRPLPPLRLSSPDTPAPAELDEVEALLRRIERVLKTAGTPAA